MYSIVNGAVWAAIPKLAYAVVIAIFGIAVGLGIFERVSYDADGIRNMMLREEAMMVGGNPEDVSLDWNAAVSTIISTTAETSSSVCGNITKATSESLT